MGLASLTSSWSAILTLRRCGTASRAFGEVATRHEQGHVDAIHHRCHHEAHQWLDTSPVCLRSGVTTYWHARNTADIPA